MNSKLKEFEDWAPSCFENGNSENGSPSVPNFSRHPIAEAFDIPLDDDYRDFVEDVRNRGLLEPITLYDGMILDGWMRELACREIGLPPVYREYKGNDPIAEFVSRNLLCHHLEKAQRAVLVALSADPALQAKHGGLRDQGPEVELVTLKRQAKLAGCGTTLQGMANTVVKVDPELARRVLARDVSIAAAHAQVKPKEILVKKPKPDVHADCKEQIARLEKHIGTTDPEDPEFLIVSPVLAQHLRERIKALEAMVRLRDFTIFMHAKEFARHKKAGHVLPQEGEEE